MSIRTSTVLLLTAALLRAQDPTGRAVLTGPEREQLAAGLGDPPEAVLRMLTTGERIARREAGAALQALDRRLEARFLRAALWSDEPDVALGAAIAVPTSWLDADEAERARDLLVPHALEEGTPVDLEAFVDLLGADDVAKLIAEPAPLPREHLRYVAQLHRPMRAEHIPLLAHLTISDDALGREGAMDTMRVIAERTDRYRENVAIAILTWPGGVPVRFRFDPARERDPVTPRSFALPEPTGGFPPLLALALRRVFVTPADESVRLYELWAWRWACGERAAPGDLPLVAALAGRGDLARRIAARAAADLGARDLLDRLANDPERTVALLALAGLARIGVDDAAGRLTADAATEASALAAWLEASPDAALAALAATLCGGDIDAATAAAHRAADAVEDADVGPFRPPAELGATLAARAVEGGADPRVLAVLAARIPGARTTAVVGAWLHALDARTLDSPALDLLEVADLGGLRARLRALAADAEPATRAAALDALLAIGDAASGAELVDYVRAVEAGDATSARDADVLALARSGSPEVERFLLARIDTSDPTYDTYAALAALEACRGVDERLTRSFLADVDLDDRAPFDLWSGLRHAACTGAPGAVVLAWLAERPLQRGRLEGLGALDSAPVRAYLRRAVTERQDGLFWWATGELALAGDPAARAQVERAIDRGWYRRLDEADPRVLTDGRALATAPRWIAGLATNCCAAVSAAAALEDLIGDVAGSLTDDTGARTPERRAREFFERYASRLRPSRLAGHLVIGPG